MLLIAISHTRFFRAISPAVVLLLGLVGGCAAPQAAPSAPAAFWPPYPDEPRIQYLRSIEKSTDIQPAKNKLEDIALGKESQEVMFLKMPYGVKMWQGRIYVCDSGNGSVTIFDLHKKQTFVLGRGDADSMIKPSDIAIAPDGMKYVVDSGRQELFVYGPDDHFVTNFVQRDVKPVAVAVYQNELYICDFKGQRIVVLDRTSGRLLRTIGGPGTKKGQFNRPISVVVDAQGYVYVMDVLNCRLQKFDKTGKVVMAFGELSDHIGAFARPKHIAVDKDGIIYVVDAAFQNVQLFNQNGQVLTFFGSPGNHLGAMNLPAGICVQDGDLDLFKEWIHPAFEPERLIIVTNQLGQSRVAIYALGHLKPGKTLADIRNTAGLVPTGIATANDTGPLVGGPTTFPSGAGSPATRPVQGPVFGPSLPGGGTSK